MPEPEKQDAPDALDAVRDVLSQVQDAQQRLRSAAWKPSDEIQLNLYPALEQVLRALCDWAEDVDGDFGELEDRLADLEGCVAAAAQAAVAAFAGRAEALASEILGDPELAGRPLAQRASVLATEARAIRSAATAGGGGGGGDREEEDRG